MNTAFKNFLVGMVKVVTITTIFIAGPALFGAAISFNKSVYFDCLDSAVYVGLTSMCAFIAVIVYLAYESEQSN